MPEWSNFINLQTFILVKFCFFIFVALGIFGVYHKYKPLFFVILTGVFSALSYYIFVHGSQLMLWGVTGDEVTIAAMYEKFAHLSFLSDFAYSHLPPFYPPLFFWIGAVFGRLFDWNGIQIAKFMSFTTFLIYPTVFFLLQKYFWQSRQKNSNEKLPGQISWLLSSILLFVVIDIDAIITKPYELVSASLIILWTIFLVYDSTRGNFGWKKFLVYGLSGGILFMMFYFWFFLSAIAIGLFQLFTKTKDKIKSWFFYLGVGLITLLVAIPFWLPLARSYATLGSENWQAGFFVITGALTQGPKIAFSIVQLILVFGLFCLFLYRKNNYNRFLLTLLISGYIWQMMGLLTIFFFLAPIQEAKGFFFFNTVVLALSTAYGLEILWSKLKADKKYGDFLVAIKIFAIILLATQLFFGYFVDNLVQDKRISNHYLKSDTKELITFLEKESKPNITTLLSGFPELYATTALNQFVYFNMNNSHPGALFSGRLLVVENMSLAKSSEEFYGITQHNFVEPIERFILYKADGNAYPLFFYLDDFPYENKEKIIYLDKSFFDTKYFDKVFETQEFIVFESKEI